MLIRFLAVKEGGRIPPPYPSIFIKPSAALCDFDAPVHVPKIAQEQLDYEGELVR
jgi:2-keto-4-pentenoate hydratase/2-oxohepta-3-ene-1,7-dioic acid hydratase in catechol pathway